MQNQYVADIGDFGKYGFLKALCFGKELDEMPKYILGVVWYLFPDEGKGGGITKYLEPTEENKRKYRRCDPALYDALRQIKTGNQRDVQSIRVLNILPANTIFYEEPLTFDGMPNIGLRSHLLRINHRKKWVQNACNVTSSCDIVFLDPDNGLQIKSVQRHHKYSPKYVFLDEISPYWKRGQSLVIYQHMNFGKTAEDQINEWLSILNDFLGTEGAFALRYLRGPARAYIVIPTKTHEEILRYRTSRFLKSPWSQHFEPNWGVK